MSRSYKGDHLYRMFRLARLAPLLGGAILLMCASGTLAASHNDNKVMGEIQFDAASKVEKDSGVWIDGQYLGYLKELKGNKKVMLLPGEHELKVRQAGYEDFVRKLVVEPGQKQVISVLMRKAVQGVMPAVTSQLKLSVDPDRAAVFLDHRYVGHAGEFGGKFHYMELAPGKHHIRVELPGYRTFETDVTLRPDQKLEVKTDLAKGSIVENTPGMKHEVPETAKPQ